MAAIRPRTWNTIWRGVLILAAVGIAFVRFFGHRNFEASMADQHALSTSGVGEPPKQEFVFTYPPPAPGGRRWGANRKPPPPPSPPPPPQPPASPPPPPPCDGIDLSTMCPRVTQGGNRCGDPEVGEILKEVCAKSCTTRCNGAGIPTQEGRFLPITKWAKLARMDGADGNDPDGVWRERQQAVIAAFNHSWDGYVKYAWGQDTLRPVSRSGMNNMGGLGATIVDSIDTMLIMGMEDTEYYQKARGWIKDTLKFTNGNQVSTFETIIRVLGGLITAYDLSGGDPMYLEKAVHLGDTIIAGAFTGGTVFPSALVNMGPPARATSWNPKLAEVGTLQLEFLALSERTGDGKYAEKAVRIVDSLEKNGPPDHLYPKLVEAHSGRGVGEITLGGDADSYFEYLLKVWVYGGKGKRVERYKRMWDSAMMAAHARMIEETPEGFKFCRDPPHHTMQMGHLTCFVPGMLALGAHHSGAGDIADEMMPLAEDLGRTCYMMYHRMPTGLSPEGAAFHVVKNPGSNQKPPCYLYPGGKAPAVVVHEAGGGAGGAGADPSPPPPPAEAQCDDFHWNIENLNQARAKGLNATAPVGSVGARDTRNFLRPETVESLFYLWRFTGDPKYREWGWEIFQAFERETKVESGGYSGLHFVTANFPANASADARHANMDDEQQTFWLAETLKYFYLLFSPNELIPLDEWVFNTEAHPVKIQNNKKTPFPWAYVDGVPGRPKPQMPKTHG